MSEPHKWYCQEHQTVEPTRYACVNKVLAAKDERIRTLEAEVEEERQRNERLKLHVRDLRRDLHSEVERLRDHIGASGIAYFEQLRARVRELEQMLNHGFCRRCGETYAPTGGSDPEHRWPY